MTKYILHTGYGTPCEYPSEGLVASKAEGVEEFRTLVQEVGRYQDTTTMWGTLTLTGCDYPEYVLSVGKRGGVKVEAA